MATGAKAASRQPKPKAVRAGGQLPRGAREHAPGAIGALEAQGDARAAHERDGDDQVTAR